VGGNGKEAPSGAHNRIAINGNRISESPYPAIVVTSTRELTIADNVLGHQKGWLTPERFGLKPGTELPPIQFSNCSEVAGNNAPGVAK